MLKVTVEVNKTLKTSTFSFPGTFPKIEGKLIALEANGKELQRYNEAQEIPLTTLENVYITWHGRAAARALRTFKELFQ